MIVHLRAHRLPALFPSQSCQPIAHWVTAEVFLIAQNHFLRDSPGPPLRFSGPLNIGMLLLLDPYKGFFDSLFLDCTVH